MPVLGQLAYFKKLISNNAAFAVFALVMMVMWTTCLTWDRFFDFKASGIKCSFVKFGTVL